MRNFPDRPCFVLGSLRDGTRSTDQIAVELKSVEYIMIYLIGGAPRVGKSILCQQLAASLRMGWLSTDVMMELLRLKKEEGVKTEWRDPTPDSIKAAADWFLPYLDRFLWAVSSMAEGYVIEGVDFLPGQVQGLSAQYQIRSVFLGCSHMTLETFDQFPGRSPGYTFLPEETRRRIVEAIPRWSAFIQQEAKHYGLAYIDMAHDFPRRLAEAERILTAG